MSNAKDVEIHRGVTFGFYRRAHQWTPEQVTPELDHMVELNVKWVCLVPTIMKDEGNAPWQYHDFEITPSDIELADTIDAIHERGMKVCLRGMIENYDGWGRLKINFPPDGDGRIPGLSSTKWARWWRGMNARTRHYARIAQRTGCEMYGLDSEIDSFIHMNEPWREVLATAREHFDGPVTSCHTHHVDFIRLLENDPHSWLRDLDVLGVSMYHASETEPGWDVERRTAHLTETVLPRYRRMHELLGKPIQFAECGCTACTGAGMHPAAWSGGDKFDGAEQADHLEAIFRTFWDEPWWGGLYWWKWDENNHRPQFLDDPAGNKGFTIYGKPAAETMKTWYGKGGR